MATRCRRDVDLLASMHSGRAAYSPSSQIRARVWTSTLRTGRRGFLPQAHPRFSALVMHYVWKPDDAFAWYTLNGWLPGLIVDRYALGWCPVPRGPSSGAYQSPIFCSKKPLSHLRTLDRMLRELEGLSRKRPSPRSYSRFTLHHQEWPEVQCQP